MHIRSHHHKKHKHKTLRFIRPMCITFNKNEKTQQRRIRTNLEVHKNEDVLTSLHITTTHLSFHHQPRASFMFVLVVVLFGALCVLGMCFPHKTLRMKTYDSKNKNIRF